MSEKEKLINELNDIGIDVPFIIRESFLGYKYRKANNKLYNDDLSIPTKLIKMYYSFQLEGNNFDKMKSAFISHYVANESELEGIDNKSIHGKAERKGLIKMYEYIHSEDIEYMFDVYTLKDLHAKLFSLAEHPEYAGNFRNYNVYLPGTGTEISDYSLIRESLSNLDNEVQELRKISKIIKVFGSVNPLFEYLDRCVELKCKLIKIHPFGDGNGRTIRGFINKLLEDAGLPPIYIKSSERLEYHKAMNLANNENDYSEIKNFYRYKVCDSIVELDINDRLKNISKTKSL